MAAAARIKLKENTTNNKTNEFLVLWKAAKRKQIRIKPGIVLKNAIKKLSLSLSLVLGIKNAHKVSVPYKKNTRV